MKEINKLYASLFIMVYFAQFKKTKKSANCRGFASFVRRANVSTYLLGHQMRNSKMFWIRQSMDNCAIGCSSKVSVYIC